jgi:Matrixin
MKKKIFTAFFSLLFAVSLLSCCNASPQAPKTQEPLIYNIFISDTFSDEQKAIILVGLNEWAMETNGCVSFRLFEHFDEEKIIIIPVREISVIFRNVLSTDIIIQERDEKQDLKSEGDYTVGLYLYNAPIPTIYLVSDRLTDLDIFRITAEHEIGHAMKLGHSKNENDIMFENTDNIPEKELSDGDLSAFCEKHNCNNCPSIKEE